MSENMRERRRSWISPPLKLLPSTRALLRLSTVKALQLVVKECKPKSKIVDICEKGDSFIREQTGNMYKNAKKEIEKGVAFPTCISVNNVVCHFSPLASDTSELEEGDMVKIDMGCHIDGFIAVVARTHVDKDGPVSGRQADVIAAANTAAEVALRLVRPGKKIIVLIDICRGGNFAENKDVTDAIQKVAAAYDCKIVEGVLSRQLKQFVIDGNKVILSVSDPDTRVDDADFEESEVYAVDIVASTGEGKPKLLDEKQTSLFIGGLALEEKRARLVLVECVNQNLLQPYPVLHEKPGDYIAHIMFTVLLMPNGSVRITSHPLQELQPTKVIDDPEAWLALGTKTEKRWWEEERYTRDENSKKGDKADEAEAGAEPMDATTDGGS
ncbi:ERBB-3 BINDING PROTEIN 1 [Hibiscus syriacus]|uniref:ERBB-3 BINDING PROTEIN 1 n=1 Tax=Hibiscus syriacus TaxID=106335 RepID=A0A6A2WM18_HIBSY|nr:ERBB-3 BINDING PROTEIN 1 [Hibiscus syriacus]